MYRIKKVFKYDVLVKAEQTLQLPLNSKVLKIGNKIGNDVMSLWAMVEDRQPVKLPLDIMVVGTGNPVDDKLDLTKYEHFDTVIMHNQMVWHVFVNSKQLAEFK